MKAVLPNFPLSAETGTMIDNHSVHSEAELVRIDHVQHDAADEAGSEERERLRLLGIRKKQELKLVKKFDKSKINVSKECWFLIDSDWLNKWSTFVNGDESEDCPDALSTKGENYARWWSVKRSPETLIGNRSLGRPVESTPKLKSHKRLSGRPTGCILHIPGIIRERFQS